MSRLSLYDYGAAFVVVNGNTIITGKAMAANETIPVTTGQQSSSNRYFVFKNCKLLQKNIKKINTAQVDNTCRPRYYNAYV